MNYFHVVHFTFFKTIIFLIFSLSTLLPSGCRGQDKKELKQTPATEKQRFIRKKHYGSYELNRWGDIFRCEINIDSSRLAIEEVHPGVLVHNRRAIYDYSPPGNTIAVEYYDTISGKLKRRIDLEKINPYNKKLYPNIGIGGMDYESMNVPGPFYDCVFPKMPQPDLFYTRNWVSSSSPNGYICVSFVLIKISSPNDVVGWEQALLVLDSEGREIRQIKFSHETHEPIVLNDGKYLCVSSRSSETPENPFEPCRPELKIFNLDSGKLIFYYAGEIGATSGEIKEIDSTVYFRFSTPKTAQSEQLIIDLSKREMASYKFISKEPLLPEWGEYVQFLKTLSPTSTKF
jgi:hypothetical protein